MRFCPECRRINEGFPERCRFCGSTWGVRICRRGHLNPPDAAFCGECGSADLSRTARGGGIINSLLGIGRHGRFIWLVIKVLLPILLIVVISKNPEYYLPLLLPICILIIALRLAIGVIPSWIIRPLVKTFKPKSKNRAKKRESRGQ